MDFAKTDGKSASSDMPGKKRSNEIDLHETAAANRRVKIVGARPEPPRVSGRWLIFAALGTVAAATFCTWGALCLLFSQGSWQLLYHPAAKITNTPASVGLAFEPVAFAVSEEGTPRLRGWWMPAAQGDNFDRFTVLFLHGQTGNLGDAVDALARLHAVGVNVLAFDYRGFGQSRFARPSEANWREDAEWALDYLTETRHIDGKSIVLDGRELGANLALEVGAAHPELGGVIVESPMKSPLDVIFLDPRAKLVPARLLVRDRYDLEAAAKDARIPALWVEWTERNGTDAEPAAYKAIATRKRFVWLTRSPQSEQEFAAALSRWFGDLPGR